MRLRRRLIAGAALAVLAVVAPQAAGAANGPIVLAGVDRLVLQPPGGAETVVGDRRATIVGASRSGRLMAASSGADGDVTIMDATGRVLRAFDFRGIVVHSLDVSPDGRRLALTALRDAEPFPGRIYPYVANADGTGLRRLRTRLPHTYDLRFTRDGGNLVYAGSPSTGGLAGCASLRRVRLSGARDRLLYQALGGASPCVVTASLSPGGSSAAFVGDPAPRQPSVPGQPRTALYRVALNASAAPRLLASGAFAATWSPDGKEIAFSTGSGTFRVSQFGGTPTLASGITTLSLGWLKAGG